MAKKVKVRNVGKTDFSDAKVMVWNEDGKAEIVTKAEAKKREAKASK